MRRPEQGAVHVWRIRLDVPTNRVALRNTLSHDELERTARFHFQIDRRRYMSGRCALRTILARYTGARPETLRFVYGPQGKPALEGSTLQFNLAHSESTAVLAVSQHVVGIDVERVAAFDDMRSLALEYFTATESSHIASAGPGAPVAFFRCWTTKEAYLKANGGGLSIPLRSISVALTGPPALVSIDDAPASGWSVSLLTPRKGYLGAVAAHAEVQDVRRITFNWPPELCAARRGTAAESHA